MAPLLLTGHRGYLGACVAALLTQAGVPHRLLATRLHEIAPASLDVSGVIHCAGPLRHRGDAVQMDHHCHGTRTLLSGLVRPVPVVYVSSRSVYGRANTELLDETAPAAPVDAYGAAKLAAEVAIRESGVPFMILRASTLIGLGVGQEDGHSFLRQALHRLRAGETVTRYAPDRMHDALDVWAAAQACIEAWQGAHWNDTCNLAGPVRSLHATLDALAAASGAADRWRELPDDSAGWGVLDSRRFCDSHPAWQRRSDAELFEAWVAGLRASAGV